MLSPCQSLPKDPNSRPNQIHVEITLKSRVFCLHGDAVGMVLALIFANRAFMSDLTTTKLQHDLSLGSDVLLILNTSLKVHRLKAIVKEFATRAGSGVVNRMKPPGSVWGDVIDYWVEWVLNLKNQKPSLWSQHGGEEKQERLPKASERIGKKRIKRKRGGKDGPDEARTLLIRDRSVRYGHAK
jgi:hypothetical protein